MYHQLFCSTPKGCKNLQLYFKVHAYGAGLIQILFYPIKYIQLIWTVPKKKKKISPLAIVEKVKSLNNMSEVMSRVKSILLNRKMRVFFQSSIKCK